MFVAGTFIGTPRRRRGTRENKGNHPLFVGKDRPSRQPARSIFAYMYYVIDKPALLESIREEVSHVADEAFADDGTALYDSVMVTLRDNRTLDRFIDDAVNAFVRREFDIAKFAPAEDSTPRLQFYIPDFDETMADAAKAELDRYIVLYACAAIFQQRRASVVPEYTTRTQSAMDKAVSLLKSRKHPVTTW